MNGLFIQGASRKIMCVYQRLKNKQQQQKKEVKKILIILP